MVIIITTPILLAICLALAAPYLWIGIRAVITGVRDGARDARYRHGLRDLEER